MYYCYDILLYALFLPTIISREVPDLTFGIRNISNKIESICIADTNILNSPISWSYPIEDMKDKLPIIVSKYIPELENDYNCDFLKTKQCSNLWRMEDWQFSKIDSHQFKPILDGRWESYPTLLTSNFTEEFKNRIDIPHVFEVGMSIRTLGTAEIFFCTGWSPYLYPCYYISIGGSGTEQAFLRKYKSIPKQIGTNDVKLDKYTSDAKVLSEDEWSNFIISLNHNGTFVLVDTFKNITLLSYEDTKALQPIFLFIRSKNTKALWKIYTSHYIFTNKPKLVQLGPTFSVYGNNLCVFLYVSVCRYCTITFYILTNGERQLIKSVFNENDHDELLWKEIRLVWHDILEDKIKLFVETKYSINLEASNGFWGIDDVRLCSDDEIKVTHLIPKVDWPESDLQHISCQALSVPTWRPIQYVIGSSIEEIEYTPTSTTIKGLRKSKVYDEHHIQQHYVMQYEGKDICNHSGILLKSRARLKSQGFVIARSSEFLIKDLVPYTRYSVTFWNIVDDIKIERDVSTLSTELPSNEELPKNVAIQVIGLTCEIAWNAPNCNETFGPIIYQVTVYIKNGTLSNTQTDVTTSYTFKGLQLSLNYEVEIRTSRRLENLNNLNLSVSSVYNFTTYTNNAPSVENLEVYATTASSAQLRFKIPKNWIGKLNSTQLRWCHSMVFSECNSSVRKLTKCKLWEPQFCIDINNLTAGFTYTFFMSLKDQTTLSDGKETNISAVIADRVPGTPSDVTYKIRNCVKTEDCCHLNISWAHPFNQSGSITMFDIILTEYSFTYVMDSFKSIYEVLKVTENSYQAVYNYNIRYISCSVPYKISVRAINDHYKGEFASTTIAVNEDIAYVDPMPKYVNSTNETVIFKLPPAESGFEESRLMIVVQNYNKSKTEISKEINNLEIFNDVNELCNDFGETWIAKEIKLNGTSLLAIIGDGTTSYISRLNKTVINKHLTPDTEYCFTFTIFKIVKDSEHVIVYHDKNLFTEPNHFASHLQDDKDGTVTTFWLPVLFIILLILCGAWISYRFFKKRRNGTNSEPIYEAMPFDDYLTDAVFNDTYDHLNHE